MKMSNQAKLSAALAGRGQVVARSGLITAYDEKGNVKVMIKPDELETGWIPYGSCFVGDEYGLAVGPVLGTACLIIFELGQINAGVALCGYFNIEDKAPPVPSGEFWVIHKTGSFLKFKNDGNVELNVANDLQANVAGNANLDVTGDLGATVGGALDVEVTGNMTAEVHGDVTATVDGSATLDAASAHIGCDVTVDGTVTAVDFITTLGTTLNTHLTSNVESGVDISGPPVPGT